MTSRKSSEEPLQSWGNILLALQSTPQGYLKNFLTDHIQQLVNSGRPFEPRQKAVEDVETIDGQSVTLAKQSRTLAERLSEKADIDITASARIVLLPENRGKDDREILLAYIQEKHNIIKTVLDLFRISNVEGHLNQSLAKDVVIRICADELFVPRCMECIKDLSQPLYLEEEMDDETAAIYAADALLEQSYLLKLVFIAMYDRIPVEQEHIAKWLDIMKQTSFLSDQPSTMTLDEGHSRLIESLPYVALTICIELLGLESNPAAMNSNSFVNSTAAVSEVQDLLLDLSDKPIAAPLLLAWSIFLHRLPPSTVEQLSFPADLTRQLASHALESGAFKVITYAAYQFLDDNTLGYKTVLAELLSQALNYVKFNEVVVHALTAVHGDQEELSFRFWNTAACLNSLAAARARFPYESGPLITLIRSISASRAEVYNYLSLIPTYTQALPIGFRSYDVVSEDNSGTSIVATSEVVVFGSRSDGEGGITIPRGTKGRIVSHGSSPTIVMWDFPHNIWLMFGRTLETAIADSSVRAHTASLSDIISLLATAVTNAGSEVLNYASEHLAPEVDVVSLVTEVVKQMFTDNDIDTSLFISCMDFFEALIDILPARVWSMLSKSGLLARGNQPGRATQIVESCEKPRASFGATCRLLRLYHALIDESISSAVLSRGVRNATRSKMLLELTKHFTTVFESFHYWRFNKIEQKADIGFLILQGFHKMVSASYGLSISSAPKERVLAFLDPSCDHIFSIFFSQTASENSLSSLYVAFNTPFSLLHDFDTFEQHFLRWRQMTLTFTELLLKVSDILQNTADCSFFCSNFEKVMYSQSAQLAKIFCRSPEMKIPAIRTITALVGTSSTMTAAPSFLSYLGSYDALIFKNSIFCALSSSISCNKTKEAVWQCMSAIVEGNQLGMSILLMRTGSLPHMEDLGEFPQLSLIDYALGILADEKNRSTENWIVKLLQFLGHAQDRWRFIAPKLCEKQEALDTLLWFIDISKIDKSSAPGTVETTCAHLLCAANSAQILSQFLRLRPEEDKSRNKVVSAILGLPDECREKSMRIEGYRASLHGNLQRNFTKRWPTLDATNFARSGILEKHYGLCYFYDVDLLESVLGGDRAWQGTRSNFEEANLNLSLIDVQIKAFHAFRMLYIALSGAEKMDEKLVRFLHVVAKSALNANNAEDMSSSILEDVFRERIELAFTVLSSSASLLKSFENLTTLTWDAICSPGLAFQSSIISRRKCECHVLVRLLCICLRQIDLKAHTQPRWVLSILVASFDMLVTKTMVTIAQNANASEDSADTILLIISLLHNILLIEGVDLLFPSFISSILSSNCIQATLTIFTMADKSRQAEDMMYAELALVYLLELSEIPEISEQLAMHGIVDFFIENDISSQLERGNIRPESDLQLHTIWTRGMLPIVVNLVRFVGGRIGSQLNVFNHFFEAQIQTSLESWAHYQPVSIPSINETMLLTILLEQQDYASLDNGKEIAGLKEGLAESINYLLSHVKYLGTLVISTSVEEQNALREKADGTNRLTKDVVERLETFARYLTRNIEDQDA